MIKKTFDNTTAASNPGTIRVTREDFVRYEATSALGRYFLYANSFLPVTFSFGGVIGGYRWQHFLEWFRYGDTNPAVVIDAQAGLVAAFTDLDSRLQKRFPTIKIFQEKLHLLASPAKNGDTFAVISAYGRGEYSQRTGKWGDYYPVVLDCVIRDAVACEFTKAMIPDAEWQALEIGLAQIINKAQPGLYDVILPDELKAAL